MGRSKVASFGSDVSRFGGKVPLRLVVEVVKASFTASDAAKEAFTALRGDSAGHFRWSEVVSGNKC